MCVVIAMSITKGDNVNQKLEENICNNSQYLKVKIVIECAFQQSSNFNTFKQSKSQITSSLS